MLLDQDMTYIMKKALIYCLAALLLLVTQPVFAQDSDAGVEADIDSSEDEVIQKFVDMGESIEKEVKVDLKEEASRDLELLKEKESRSSSTAPAITPTIATPDPVQDDSIASIEQEVDELKDEAPASH